jgi:2-methylisocitrate lyase-like PEP mutase family enzyme
MPAARRQSAMRAMADARGVPFFINARTDMYFDSGVAPAQRLEQAKARAAAYLRAGASGFFAPGLTDLDEIAALCASTSLPVNIMLRPGSPDVGALAKAGAKRISYGPGPYISAMESVRGAASAVFAQR